MENETKPKEEVKTEDLVKRAEDAASRLEAANKKADEIHSRNVLSGKAEAGQPEVKPKPETPQEYAKRIIRNEI